MLGEGVLAQLLGRKYVLVFLLSLARKRQGLGGSKLSERALPFLFTMRDTYITIETHTHTHTGMQR